MCPPQDRLRQADAVAAACAETLGDALVAAIVHGSLALGGYLPGRSDVDVLAVVAGTLTDTQVAELGDAVAALNLTPRVDLWIVTAEVAAAPTPEPILEAGLVVDGGIHVEARRVPARDLLVDLSVARVHGRSLVGPPPRDVIGEVPDEWVEAAGAVQVAAWERIGDDPPHAEITVLTTCRIWRFAEERRHGSKQEAAEWALAREPGLRAVREALRQREDPSQPIDPREVARLLEHVRARIPQ